MWEVTERSGWFSDILYITAVLLEGLLSGTREQSLTRLYFHTAKP